MLIKGMKIMAITVGNFYTYILNYVQKLIFNYDGAGLAGYIKSTLNRRLTICTCIIAII